MSDLLAARSQMALSLGFHIIFAAIGMAMPLLMVIAEWRWLKTRDPVWLEITKRWSRGVAILVGIGAVSGTVLSFELGLLWPKFMAFAGPIVGMPFSLEGFAFFMEAIFLGVVLYGWDRVSERVHLFSGVMVLIGGVASGGFVLCANGWMNDPQGFDLDANGALLAVRPFEAMFNRAALYEVPHMTIAAFEAVGFAVAAVHAWRLLRNPGSEFHRKALAVALSVGAVSALLQPIMGDLAAGYVADAQPAKFAAMEAHWTTQAGAPVVLGGWPDEEAEVTRYGIEIPYLLSFLAHKDIHAPVTGLSDIPKDERPPVGIVHLAFDVMVGCGMVLAGVALLAGFFAWRRRDLLMHPRFLRLLVLCGPLGFIAIEAGWVVTEVGRQPWVIWGLMRTKDAVTPMPGLTVTFTLFSLLYVFLAVVCVALLRRNVLAADDVG